MSRPAASTLRLTLGPAAVLPLKQALDLLCDTPGDREAWERWLYEEGCVSVQGPFPRVVWRAVLDALDPVRANDIGPGLDRVALS